MIIRLSNRAVRPLTAAAFVLGALAAPALATHAAAQMSMPQPPPQIVVSARGEVQVAPDRAQVQVGMETQARTAAIASQENNKKQTAILAAIRALGIPASQIQTLNYSVMPIQRYDEKTQRVMIDGYRVSNIVQVETDKIEQAGPIIDAALTNGGNRVAGLDFLVKDRAKAQETALTKAVESARRQAEVAAKAAGGQVAELLELNINEYERPQPRAVMAMAKREMADASAPTPVSEGMATIAVSVTTRWRFTK
ncbi:SIMPL domain-containing protein [Gemmatimonas sp.]|uniref:SIMPL domain-containing protein n=1 Tax=Gemmatimonas sp. TaxID=1962908 RepID=UPI00286E3458|nr:SIMPL domain-containing protein [Gemmatimonas sp.]